MIEAISVQQQLIDLIEANEAIDDLVEGRCFTRPLKRATEANNGTPDAFEEQPPNWLLPSIVIPERADMTAFLGTRRVSTRYAAIDYRIAIYAPPDGSQTVRGLAMLIDRVVAKQWVTLPDGSKGRVVTPHDMIGPVDVPEFPGAGVVAFLRVQVALVFDRT